MNPTLREKLLELISTLSKYENYLGYEEVLLLDGTKLYSHSFDNALANRDRARVVLDAFVDRLECRTRLFELIDALARAENNLWYEEARAIPDEVARAINIRDAARSALDVFIAGIK